MATRRITRTSPSALRTVSAPLPTTQGIANPEDLLRLALGSELTLNIPEDAKMADVEQTLQVAITGYKRLSEASERLKPLIGRILYTVQSRRLYRPDYRNLTDYIERKVVVDMGLSRTNAFEALRIAKAFPSMTMEDYQKYGASRLLLASSITDEADPQAKQLLDDSTRQTVDEFQSHIRDLKSESVEPAKTFVLSIRLPLDWKPRWEDLIATVDLTPVELFLELMNSYIQTHPASKASTPAPASATPASAKAS